MRSIVWLYLFLFVAFFDLHAQYPILTPYAVSLGAAPTFIGLMMGIYSFTHLPGNLLAGYGVDRYGSRIFIICSLIGAGILMVLQAHVSNPWELLVVRSISGFVLAFLSPACLALLAQFAQNQVQQGKLMAGNGLVHTLASVVSPAAGVYLVAKLGFTVSFQALGVGLILIGMLSILFIRSPQDMKQISAQNQALRQKSENTEHAIESDNNTQRIPWSFYILPLAISCSQGILFFELPFSGKELHSMMHSGILFTSISLGALCTLSMLFLNHYPARIRTWAGSMSLALLFFILAVKWPVPMVVILFGIGMMKGIVLPALSTHLLQLSGGVRYGRIFSYLSIAFSIGSFLGPVIAGQLRDIISPYYIAFVILMTAILLMPSKKPLVPTSAAPPKLSRTIG